MGWEQGVPRGSENLTISPTAVGGSRFGLVWGSNQLLKCSPSPRFWQSQPVHTWSLLEMAAWRLLPLHDLAWRRVTGFPGNSYARCALATKQFLGRRGAAFSLQSHLSIRNRGCPMVQLTGGACSWRSFSLLLQLHVFGLKP